MKGFIRMSYLEGCPNCRNGCVACSSDFKDLYEQYKDRADYLEKLLEELYNSVPLEHIPQSVVLEVIRAVDWGREE